MKQRILDALKERNWSVRKLHEESGIRYGSLNDFLRHGKKIGWDNFVILSDTLGLRLVRESDIIITNEQMEELARSINQADKWMKNLKEVTYSLNKKMK